MKRVLCIWLPNWPIQRLVVAQPELEGRALVVSARVKNRGERVAACSPQAAQRGIRVGLPLPETTALWEKSASAGPTPATSRAAALQVVPYDPAADRQQLLRLAEWCEQFSPLVGLAEDPSCSVGRGEAGSRKDPEDLLLEVTGLGRWFGSEVCLAEQVVTAFQQRGYVVQVAIADTIGAAWAVAHFDLVHFDNGSVPRPPFRVIPPGQNIEVLRLLPVEALRLPAETVEVLQQLGVFQIQTLLRLPRAGLAARLGPVVLQRLDQAVGTAEEVLVTHRPPPEFVASWSAEYPSAQRAVIESVLQRLVAQVAQLLADRQCGAVQVEVRLDCVREPRETPPSPAAAYGNAFEHALRFRLDLFRPLAEPAHLWDLLRMQLEPTLLPGPVRGVRVQVVVAVPLERRQSTLFGDAEAETSGDLARLVDRLGSRLGRQCVLRPCLEAEAQPELACGFSPLAGPETGRPWKPLGEAVSQRPEMPGPNDRPLQLLPAPRAVNVMAVVPDGPPVRFHDQGRWHLVARCWGPERIETGWWRGHTVRRDYYRVETPSGHRFWLFCRLDDGKWFVQGTFA